MYDTDSLFFFWPLKVHHCSVKTQQWTIYLGNSIQPTLSPSFLLRTILIVSYPLQLYLINFLLKFSSHNSEWELLGFHSNIADISILLGYVTSLVNSFYMFPHNTEVSKHHRWMEKSHVENPERRNKQHTGIIYTWNDGDTILQFV